MAKSEPQLITPLEKLEALPPFEGRPVLGVGIEIPGAGGGLRDSLTIDPVVYHYGDVVHVVVKGRVGKIRFDPVKDAGEAVRRIHVLEVEDAVLVDAEDVTSMLDAQAARIEEARGLLRLPFDELTEQHEAGEHAADLVDDCPECDREREAMEAENLELRDELADRRTAKAAGGDDDEG